MPPPKPSAPADDASETLRRILLTRGVLSSPAAALTALTGGVSSEIYRVEDAGRVFVVKRALPKLKVAADWFADPARNAHEQAYIAYVSRFNPSAMPAIIARGEADGFFAMEFLEGYTNWKDDLLAGHASPIVAARAAAILGEIHAQSWNEPSAAARFDTLQNFHELRISPYLLAAAEKHPELKPLILTDAESLANTRVALVHGDYSPKNMLFRADRLVVLDCEVAWYGDPAFDVGFLLNHLLLKSLLHSPGSFDGRAMVDAVIGAYGAANPHAAEVIDRTPRLLRWLLLARVDGKSPVEYLSPSKQAHVRTFVRTHTVLLKGAAPALGAMVEAWFSSLSQAG